MKNPMNVRALYYFFLIDLKRYSFNFKPLELKVTRVERGIFFKPLKKVSSPEV